MICMINQSIFPKLVCGKLKIHVQWSLSYVCVLKCVSDLCPQNVSVICVLYHVRLASLKSPTGKFVTQQEVNCFFKTKSTIFL
jgi:hypothetical protein